MSASSGIGSPKRTLDISQIPRGGSCFETPAMFGAMDFPHICGGFGGSTIRRFSCKRGKSYAGTLSRRRFRFDDGLERNKEISLSIMT